MEKFTMFTINEQILLKIRFLIYLPVGLAQHPAQGFQLRVNHHLLLTKLRTAISELLVFLAALLIPGMNFRHAAHLRPHLRSVARTNLSHIYLILSFQLQNYYLLFYYKILNRAKLCKQKGISITTIDTLLLQFRTEK